MDGDRKGREWEEGEGRIENDRREEGQEGEWEEGVGLVKGRMEGEENYNHAKNREGGREGREGKKENGREGTKQMKDREMEGKIIREGMGNEGKDN